MRIIVCLCAGIQLLCMLADVAAQPHGIDSRTTNTALVLDSLPPDTPGAMEIVRAFPRLTFNRPVLLIESPDADGTALIRAWILGLQTSFSQAGWIYY